MQNILKNTPSGDHSSTSWMLLLILGGYILAALFLFNYLALLIVAPLYNLSQGEILQLLVNPFAQEDARAVLMIIQGVTSFGTFLLVPFMFIRLNLHLSLRNFFSFPSDSLRPLFMTVIILFCFMVANSAVIEWNQSMDLPDIFNFFERWAQDKESQLEKLTKYLTTFDSTADYLFGLLVIAIIPAVGEELLFRGLIQNLFNKTFKNPHAAIWFSAFLFGVFHLQFYGVVPRILLGALFGYLYYWSGHLSLAMVGHFVNNGLTLTLLYFSQLGLMSYDPLSEEVTPPFYVIAIFFMVGTVLLILFRSYFSRKSYA